MRTLKNNDGTFTVEALEHNALLQAMVQWDKGTICVFRDYQAKPAVLRLDNQRSYKEWNNCFSILGA